MSDWTTRLESADLQRRNAHQVLHARGEQLRAAQNQLGRAAATGTAEDMAQARHAVRDIERAFWAANDTYDECVRAWHAVLDEGVRRYEREVAL